MFQDRNIQASRVNTWLIVIYALNLLDLIFSCIGLRMGCIEETNPLMRMLYVVNPYFFILCKIVIPLVFIFIVSKLLKYCVDNGIIMTLIISTACTYGAVIFTHVRWVFHLL